MAQPTEHEERSPEDEAKLDRYVQKSRHRRRRWEVHRRTYVAMLPDWYPSPRAEDEWKKYKWLRQWWTKPQVLNFVAIYNTDDWWYPGNLDRPGGPSLEQFWDAIGLLANGVYLRSLSADKALKEIGGDDLARGRNFKPKGRGTDSITKLIDEAVFVIGEKAKPSQVREWIKKSKHLKGDYNGPAVFDPEDGSIQWVENRQEKQIKGKTFDNRVAIRRKKIFGVSKSR